MKRFLAAALLALPSLALAQTTAVPDTISYQGRVTDSSGVAVGNGTAVNRTAWFRIYDAATGGTRLWSEQQTVTVANGDFSVLLGTGTAVGGETNANPLNAIFTGAQRFLGVTIDDGTAAVDTEVSPRQQIVTTAFAFRAKVAETVISQSVTAAMIANNAITNTQIADGTIQVAKMAANSVDSGKIVDGTIVTADLANASVTAAKLGSDVGYWTPSGNNVLRTVGNVGIGTTVPTVSLSLGGVVANTKLAVWDNGAGGLMGFGIGGSQFRFHVNQSADRFSFLNAPNGTEVFTIAGGGNVGIGATAPQANLHVHSSGNDSRALFTNVNTGGGTGDGLAVGTQDAGAFIWNHEPTSLRFATSAAERMRISPTGEVGIGHNAPPFTLSLYDPNTARISFQNSVTGAGSGDGLQIGSATDHAFVWNMEPTMMHFGTSGAERLRIEADGRMGFNQANGDGNLAYLFRSLASYYIMTILDRNGAWAFSFTEDGTAYKKGGTSWTSLSDARLKKNVANVTGSLERLLSLRSVNFDFIDEANGKGRQTGFIAQEVEKIFPEWVKKAPDGYLGLSMNGFESQTVQALRELRAEKDAQNAALAARVKELEARNEALTVRVAELATKNASDQQRFDALEQKLNTFAKTVATASGTK